MKEEIKNRLKDEMKNKISMALKDPILQQGFEIICKENAEQKALIKSEHEIEARKNNNLISQLDKAKEMLRWFLIYEKGVGIITNFNNFLNEVAEFINYTE